jgi:arylsulfatase A-like enzyme
VPCVFIENGKVANYDASAPIYVSYSKNFEGEPTGRNNPELLYNLKHSHGHDMSIVNGIGRIGYMKGGGKALWQDENIADSITAHAVEFMKKQGNTPFFIYFATNDVHVPRFPHQRFRGKTGMGHRGDAIAQFDWCVGEIVKTLKELNLLDNTLIILTSDNGPVIDDGYDDRAEELLGGHNPMGGLRGGKYSCFEAGTRVPFIVHWSGKIKGGKEKNALVSQIDFLDVMSAIIDSNKEKNLSPDGLGNQAPAWLGNDNKGREILFQMAANRNISLRTGKWKYIPPCKGAPMITWGPKIETGYSPAPQLYHVKNENKNRAAKNPDKVKQLQTAIDNIRTTPANNIK